MLTELPELRENEGMMRGYGFLMDFLEAVGAEASKHTTESQALLRFLLVAASESEEALESYIATNLEKV